MYKDNYYNNNIKEEATLEYKEHQEFFNNYYDAKKAFNETVNRAYLDLSYIPEAFGKLFEFVNCCISQIEEDLNIEEINKEKNKIIDMIKSGKKIQALDTMSEFYSRICTIAKNLSLEPRPERTNTKDLDLEKLGILEAFKAAGRV